MKTRFRFLVKGILFVLLYSQQSYAQCTPNIPATFILPGQEYEVEADAGFTSYQWYRNTGSGPVLIAGAINRIYTVTQYGIYTCVIIDTYGCSRSGCCAIEFKIATCTIDIVSLTPSTCDKWSNSYSVDVRVTYSMDVMADITINGQNFTPSGISGTQTFTIGRFDSNGYTNQNVVASISNSGTCSANKTYNAPAQCRDSLVPVDPIGYIYCEQTGQIITGGTISVTSPPSGAVTIVENGSTGRYSWITNGVAGVYTMNYTPPPGYFFSSGCTPQSGVFDPTGLPDPVYIGSGRVGNVLTNPACGANPFYLQFNLSPGDPIIDHNNLPLTCPCPTVLATVTPVSCNGNISNDDAKINLSNLVNVTHYAYSIGGLSYTGPVFSGSTPIAPPGGDILTGIVNPPSPVNYHIRVFYNNECYRDYTVTLNPRVCICPQAVCLDMFTNRIR